MVSEQVQLGSGPTLGYSVVPDTLGIFLKIKDASQYQPPIDFFLNILYLSGTSGIRIVERSNKLKHLAPLPEELQRVTQFMTKAPSRAVDDTPWVIFFEERRTKRALFLKDESLGARQSQLDRERNPPVVNTKVFVWERGHFEFVRGL